jgi:membrane peptidoglycan carboxypeptidase
VQNPWRRAGIASSVAGRLAVVSVAAGLLVAGVTIPVTGLAGVVVRDAATTFNTLKVPALAGVPTRSEILDSEGKLIAYYYPDHKYRIPVSFDNIAPVMRQAIISIEDNRFYLHGALDPRGTIRALVYDLENKSVQGGSDLAQQYVKNALELSAPNAAQANADAALTPQRKIRELRIAANVEHELTPNQLLAAYLNVAYFENEAYGIQVAAERYFSTTAKHLKLTQAAMLAGMVEDPTADDPVVYPKAARTRRNVVLARMAQLGKISTATAAAAEKTKLGLHLSTVPLQTGCFAATAAAEPFFCDYVLAVLRTDKTYRKVWSELNTTGGLKIYTSMNGGDERAATEGVNYVQPDEDDYFNPGQNADTEVLIQPGTGYVRAIAENRKYGYGRGATTVDYAVDQKYDGGGGVQQGSSAKIFTLLTALKEGLPFGYTEKVTAPANLGPYTSCKGVYSYYPNLQDAEGPTLHGAETFTLYNGTTESINVFYGQLEQKVGLCQVVKTAVSLGAHRATGQSLFQPVGSEKDGDYQAPADENPSFTLGSGAYMSPMTMADAYATVASNGIYCKPEAIESIITSNGKHLPVESAGCHRVLSQPVAEAATTILQGVLTSPGTAAGRGIGRPAAAKTGTGNKGDFADFAGFTPNLAAYVSVFNPENQFTWGAMVGARSDYREIGDYLASPGQMFGDNAPGATWEYTFLHADLGRIRYFVPLPTDSTYYSEGTGINSPKPPTPVKTGGGGKGTGGGGGGTGGTGGTGGGGGGTGGGGGGGNGGGGGGGGGR